MGWNIWAQPSSKVQAAQELRESRDLALFTWYPQL